MEKFLDDEKKQIDINLSKSLSADKKKILLNDPKFLKVAKGQLKDITLDIIKNFRYYEYTDLNDFNNRSYYIFQRVSDTSTDYVLINITKHHPHHLNPDGTRTLIGSLSDKEILDMKILKAKFVNTNLAYEDLIDWNKFISNNYRKCKDTKEWIKANPLATNKDFEVYKRDNPNGDFCLNLYNAKANVCQENINNINSEKGIQIQKLIDENTKIIHDKDIQIQKLIEENTKIIHDKDIQIQKLTDELTLIKMSFDNDADIIKQLRDELAGCKTSVKIDLLLNKIDSERDKKKGLFIKLGSIFSSKKGGYYEKYLKYKMKYLASKKPSI